MSYYGFRPYVPVAQRREKALKEARKAQKAGKTLSPVHVEGRKIAKTVWGQAWCDNLESYSDYENRLPRGRAYVRNGSVIDLAIEPGKVRAQVMGSSLYRIEITVAPSAKERWSRLVAEVTGSIASLVELLQGKFSKGVMEKICHPDSGLFPSPKEITLSCSCPDWASMCKHVAATLYGVGARLDDSPELLFTLRNVAASDLIAEAAKVPSESKKSPARGRALETEGLDELFGIELEKNAEEEPTPRRRRPGRPSREESAKTVKTTVKKPAPPRKSEEEPTLSRKRGPTTKKTAVKTKVATRPGKAALASSRAPVKVTSPISQGEKAGGADMRKTAEKKGGTTRKKASSVSAKVLPVQGEKKKTQRGRPPGKSPTARKSSGSKTRKGPTQ